MCDPGSEFRVGTVSRQRTAKMIPWMGEKQNCPWPSRIKSNNTWLCTSAAEIQYGTHEVKNRATGQGWASVVRRGGAFYTDLASQMHATEKGCKFISKAPRLESSRPHTQKIRFA